MLLVFTLVFIFHGFQTHALHLSDLFDSAESVVSACVCHRSTWDILWSCLATIFAGLWISIHPNIPLPNEAGWKVFLRRSELMFWAIIGPELAIVWAIREWLGARDLENLYKERRWTKTHAFFLQMGGFMLFEGDVAKGVLSPEKFSELLKLGKIKFPTVTLEEIEDRSKASGFSNTIAIGQALRFFIQCLTRRAEHFDLTLVEQLTLSYTVLNGVMYFLWWHKPLDVRSRVRVNLLSELPEEDPVEPDVATFSHFSSEMREMFHEMFIAPFQPLSTTNRVVVFIFFVIVSPFFLAAVVVVLLMWLVTYLTTRLTGHITRRQNIINPGDMRVPTFHSSTSEIAEERAGVALGLLSIAGVVFGGILHYEGWLPISLSGVNPIQAILWSVSSGALTGVACLSHDIFHIGYVIRSKIARPLSFSAVLLIHIFVLLRLFLLVQAFISLRHLTPAVLVSTLE